jgi:hypothetical protein
MPSELTELYRKHNLALELYIRSETETGSRHYQRLAFHYYSRIEDALKQKDPSR